MASQPTRFGSLRHFEKGGVEVIKDDPRNYVFSNVFEVASKAKPYEKVAVGKNIEYVIEAIRAEGTSGWRVAAQDEFALVMDGEVEVHLVGTPEGVKTGGILEAATRMIAIEALARDLPEGIELDVSALQMGDVLRVSDLTVPEGVTVLTDADEPVASVVAPKVAKFRQKFASRLKK